MRRLLALTTAVLVLTVGHATADDGKLAEPSAELSEHTAAYDAALGEALSAHERGEHAAAYAAMERAHAMSPSARTLRGLGIMALAQDRALEAIGHLRAALAEQVKPLTPELRASVESILADALAQVATLRLEPAPDGGRYAVDGAAPFFYAGEMALLTPGEHVVTLAVMGREVFTRVIVVARGERHALHVVAPEAHPCVAGPRLPEVVPPVHVAWRLAPTLRLGLYGSGAATVAAGGALWLAAYFRFAKLDAACERGCSDAELTRRYRGDNIEGLAQSAAVLGGAGVATLLATAGAELWRARRAKRERVSVVGGPLSIALRAHY